MLNPYPVLRVCVHFANSFTSHCLKEDIYFCSFSFSYVTLLSVLVIFWCIKKLHQDFVASSNPPVRYFFTHLAGFSASETLGVAATGLAGPLSHLKTQTALRPPLLAAARLRLLEGCCPRFCHLGLSRGSSQCVS